MKNLLIVVFTIAVFALLSEGQTQGFFQELVAEPTMAEAITELQLFPLNESLAYYRRACNARPNIRTLCDPGFRRAQQDDLSALLEARSLGITLKMPFVPSKKSADYEVGDPFKIDPSGLRKQLEALKAIAAGGSGSGDNGAAAAAAAAAAKLAADQNAAAAAAAAKAALDAKTAADAEAAAKAAQDKAAADAAAAAAANDAAAAAAAAEAKAKADADAAAAAAAAAAAKAAADKAAADKAAADKAAADAAAAAAAAAAAEANRPRIRRVGRFLQAPNGRTLYHMVGETPNSISCVGVCRQFWPLADPSWLIDPSAGCTGGSFVRTDGDAQLACGNRPLYMFRNDNGPNQENGLSNPDFRIA